MEGLEQFETPLAFIGDKLGDSPGATTLAACEHWWITHGQFVSEAVDKAGTPWLRMFDRAGTRIDEVCYPPDYWSMLRQGYRDGIISRVFEQNSVLPFYRLGYITAFHDPGLYCPYTVTLATAVPLEKYGSEALKKRFLPHLLRTDDEVWQGATWMTEIKGGSDLGANVETLAREQGDHWILSGDKYFASNLGADLAVVAARPESAPRDVRGLALFLLPRLKQNGELNYTVRRIKDKIVTRSVPTGEVELRDSEAWLLGKREQGVLAEYPVERWFRESMILSIWEGTAHRQILDGLEVMQRKAAHKSLFDVLRPLANMQELADIEARVEHHLGLAEDQQEAGAEKLFYDLAHFTAETLAP